MSTTYFDSSIAHLLILLELSLLPKISFSDWLVNYCVGLKIMSKLTSARDDYIVDLFHLGIILLGSCQDLQHEIHRELLLHILVVCCDFLLNDQGSADS
jgi:hypothetical protein